MVKTVLLRLTATAPQLLTGFVGTSLATRKIDSIGVCICFRLFCLCYSLSSLDLSFSSVLCLALLVSFSVQKRP